MYHDSTLESLVKSNKRFKTLNFQNSGQGTFAKLGDKLRKQNVQKQYEKEEIKRF